MTDGDPQDGLAQLTPVQTTGKEIEFAGRRLWLLAGRAVWFPQEDLLLVADTHLGKEATFRAASIPVPDGTAEDLARLSRLLAATRCRRLAILGDLLHSRRGRPVALERQVAAWRHSHAEVEMLLVRGNHDRAAGDPPRSWRIACHDRLFLGGLTLAHHPPHPEMVPTLVGHLHPKYRLQHRREALTLPCFLLRERTLILPAFGSFVDGQIVDDPQARVLVVADQEVVEVPAARASPRAHHPSRKT